ncbi:hypothetical protein ABK040_008262 [Willaertia magna]
MSVSSCCCSRTNNEYTDTIKSLCWKASIMLSSTMYSKQEKYLNYILSAMHPNFPNDVKGYHLIEREKFHSIKSFQQIIHVPYSNIVLTQIDWKDFAKHYHLALTRLYKPKLLRPDEIERRLGLKLSSSCSNNQPIKQSLELIISNHFKQLSTNNNSNNLILLGGSYSNRIYVVELYNKVKSKKLQSKSLFVIVEGSMVDVNCCIRQTLKVYQIFGEDSQKRENILSFQEFRDIEINFL